MDRKERLQAQTANPTDIFTILLIIGGEVVQVAMAQLCAGPVPYLDSVSFPFGWVLKPRHCHRGLNHNFHTDVFLRCPSKTMVGAIALEGDVQQAAASAVGIK